MWWINTPIRIIGGAITHRCLSFRLDCKHTIAHTHTHMHTSETGLFKMERGVLDYCFLSSSLCASSTRCAEQFFFVFERVQPLYHSHLTLFFSRYSSCLVPYLTFSNNNNNNDNMKNNLKPRRLLLLPCSFL